MAQSLLDGSGAIRLGDSAEAPAVFAEYVASAFVEIVALPELAVYVAVAVFHVAVLVEPAAYAAAQAVAARAEAAYC